jgi:hypothetical protein
MVAIGISIIIISIYMLSVSDNDNHVNKASLNKVNITDIKLNNEFGIEIKSIKPNQIVLIQTDIINLQNKTQPFVYIVKVEKEGVANSISYNKGVLSANEKVSVANSWIPQEEGEYRITVFVWSDIDGREVLTKKKSIEVIVG